MANVKPGESRYIALITYRRDGRPVTTPVWSAPLDGKLYVVTAKSTGKARRVRATGRVRFAPSNMNGRRTEALAALQRKYGWQLSLATLISRLRGYQDRVVLELTPASLSAVEPKTK